MARSSTTPNSCIDRMTMKAARKHLPLILLLAALVSLGAGAWNTPARAQAPAPERPVYIYFFWGDGCPHCAKAKPFFERLAARYPQIVFKPYEVYYSVENQELFTNMAREYGLEQLAVPAYFICKTPMLGYAEALDADIETLVKLHMESGCADPGAAFAGALAPAAASPTAPAPTPTMAFALPASTLTEEQQAALSTTPEPGVTPAAVGATAPPAEAAGDTPAGEPPVRRSRLEIPLLGSVDLEAQSAALSTALIAFVDGFNPCSLWVLSMLLALTLHTGSRKKVLLIGVVFLTVTTAIYALFIVGLFSVLKVASFMGWVQVVVALVALFFALVNIKDYFWYKEGISFTIADEQKPGIFQRMRGLMDASQSVWGLTGATIVFAAGVSLVEFSCTAGFPVLWTNLMVSQQVSFVPFILLLLLYLAIYQFDEMVIFLTAVYSLKASRLEEKQGRMLKLLGGMLMLTLSGVMLFNPALMNALGSTMLIFGIALLATLLVLLTHRVILPFLGVRIGSEFRSE